MVDVPAGGAVTTRVYGRVSRNQALWLQGDLGDDLRSDPCRAFDDETPFERLDPVRETAEPGSAVWIRTADPVVRNHDRQSAVRRRNRYPSRRGIAVFGDGRQGFGHDVVRGRLEGLLQPFARSLELDR
ncbi:hypothetical protein BH09ACT13_BH09ACT13_01600 [soil metagenome]